MTSSVLTHSVSVGKTADSPNRLEWTDDVQQKLEKVTFKVDHFVRGLFLAARYEPESKRGFNTTATNALLQSHFPKERLVDIFGKFIEKPSGDVKDLDYVVMHTTTAQDLKLGVRNALLRFLHNTDTQLPKKLIIPYAANGHTAFVVIEPKEDKFHITVIDSNGLGGAELGPYTAIEGAREALSIFFFEGKEFDESDVHHPMPSMVSLKRQSSGEEFPLPCAFHLMTDIENITQMEGSVYEAVLSTAHLEHGPSEIPYRSEEEVGGLIAKYSEKGRELFEKMLTDNPHSFLLNIDGRVTALTPENYQTVVF